MTRHGRAATNGDGLADLVVANKGSNTISALTNTGKGIPYLAPACPFKIIGTNTMQLPKKIVRIACHQFIPPPISELASIYVGMHKLMLIHNAA